MYAISRTKQTLIILKPLEVKGKGILVQIWVQVWCEHFEAARKGNPWVIIATDAVHTAGKRGKQKGPEEMKQKRRLVLGVRNYINAKKQKFIGLCCKCCLDMNCIMWTTNISGIVDCPQMLSSKLVFLVVNKQY
ncbi:hypothetical protein TEA_001976 [Camellia sinensis var. sinensis]|uniref:Uncharacterized protein n=1 Tax=Camellia sinensis var. sinensis TaxID=542762 RepID=A0A4V3WM07_CAMSN|nr:hypothetical protein TEA_001976 [Camellia sinensis var. sinensis]